MHYPPQYYMRPPPPSYTGAGPQPPTKDISGAPPPVKYQVPGPGGMPQPMHDVPMDNGQPQVDVPEMVNQVRNMILAYKKGPSKKQKKMRCPQYGCWKSFQRFEELQAHIASTHDWIKTKGMKPLPDGRFQVSEEILKTVFEY